MSFNVFPIVALLVVDFHSIIIAFVLFYLPITEYLAFIKDLSTEYFDNMEVLNIRQHNLPLTTCATDSIGGGESDGTTHHTVQPRFNEENTSIGTNSGLVNGKQPLINFKWQPPSPTRGVASEPFPFIPYLFLLSDSYHILPNAHLSV